MDMNDMGKVKKPRVSAMQKHIDGIASIIRKQVEKEFEPRVRARVKEYVDKHFPELELKRIELAKKIDHYDNMTNKHKPIFTADEFKSILMCLHPDGERSKERLDRAFVSFKSKEVQLVGQTKK
jgi:hypothetical protein